MTWQREPIGLNHVSGRTEKRITVLGHTVQIFTPEVIERYPWDATVEWCDPNVMREAAALARKRRATQGGPTNR